MADKHLSSGSVTRREVMGMGLAGGALLLGGTRLAAAAAEGKTDVWVLHGKDKKRLMDAALKVVSANGGLGKNVQKLTLKVNAAWYRTPAQGANTNPELVDAFLKGCKAQGVSKVVMPENPVDAAKYTFPISGLLAVAKANGATMINLQTDTKQFQEVELPRAVKLKNAKVAHDVLVNDCLVNMPVAKAHSGAGLTLGMKNWMGSVQNRGFWHRNDLHQCIADFSTLVRPTWTIIDATRIMLDHGPKGPSRHMKELDLLIVTRDPVAADAYAATLFPPRIARLARYIALAGQMKIGCADLAQMDIHKIEVS